MTNSADVLYAVIDPEDLDDYGQARVRIVTRTGDEVDVVGYPADDDYDTAIDNMTRSLTDCGYQLVGSGTLNDVNSRTMTYSVALR